jgi:hypothetical protein
MQCHRKGMNVDLYRNKIKGKREVNKKEFAIV